MRFILVGLVSNVVLYLIYLGLTSVGLGPKLAMSLAYVIGVVQTFHFNRAWSFRYRGALHGAFTRYILTYIFGYFFNLSILWFAVDHLQFPHQIVQAVAIIVVATSLFLLNKYWVFAASRRRPAA